MESKIVSSRISYECQDIQSREIQASIQMPAFAKGEEERQDPIANSKTRVNSWIRGNKSYSFVASSLKAFFLYFPKTAWLVLAGAFVLRLWAGDMEPLFNIIINFTLIYLFLKVKTIIHECGHLFAAYWAGGTPKRMILGTGHEVYRTEWRGVKVILKSVPLGGMAIALFKELPFIRWRYAFYSIGGVLFNVLAAFLMYVLLGYNSSFPWETQGIDPGSAFIFVNALGVLNLIPYYTSFYGSRMATDGLWLLKIISGSHKKYFENMENHEHYFQAFEHFEKKEYEKAYALYDSIHNKIPTEVTGLSMMAMIRIKQARPDEALTMLVALEERLDSKELTKAKGMIFNNIAWTYLLKGDLQAAYDYSSKAINVMPNNKSVGGTYGSILIEKGDVKTGMKWLFLNVDFDHPNDSTLTASIYMMLGNYFIGDFKLADKHRLYVEKNISLLENDTMLLWERSVKKVEELAGEAASVDKVKAGY